MERRQCRVCGRATDQISHVAAEKMFATGGTFTYFECSDCGTLELDDVPDQLSDYYGPDYPPFSAPGPPGATTARVTARMLRLATSAVLRSPTSARLACRLTSLAGARTAPWFALLGGVGLTTRSAILDVGCGSAHRLHTFRRLGFTDLTGTDPHLPVGADGIPGLELHRGSLQDLVGPYDLVMLHHSLEHMVDPVTALNRIWELLAAEGLLLIRVPLAGAYAWRTYGVDWVQLDAPRHLYLFTERSLCRLASASGYALLAVLHDSDAFQFWGSELYRLGLPLHGGAHRAEAAWRVVFSREEIRAFARRSKQLNALRDGDQASFLFRRRPPPDIGELPPVDSARR